MAEQFDAEYDVVVIGGGGSGLSAAVQAAKDGLTCAVLEKEAQTGGSSSFAEGHAAFESDEQEKRGITVTKDEAYWAYLSYSHWRCDPALVSRYVENAATTIKKMRDEVGAHYEDVTITAPDQPGELVTWHLVEGEIARLIELLEADARRRGVDLFMQTAAKKIVMEDGKVAGVVALDSDGEEVRLGAKAVVVATGGYASAPVVFAAFLLRPWLGLRIVLDEQNLAPGLLNKAASLLADLVLVAFRETPYFVWSTRCLFTGYPVRAAYREVGEEEPAALRRRLGVPEEATLVVVSGGSLGSRSINRALAAALPALAEVPGLFIVHGLGLARGPEYAAVADSLPRLAAALGERFDAAARTARNAAGELFYRATEYFHDFADWQRAADLVVGRAGAGALAETMALGRAMIAVPKRGLPGDHQELNAVALAEEGAVEVLFERAGLGGEVDQVPAEELAAAIVALANDPERRARLAARARALDTPESARLATEAIRLLLAGREPATTSAIVEPAFVRFQRQYDSLVAHLEATPRGLYHRLYDAKVDEYLAAGDEATVNRGIKLVGALRRADRYPELIAGLARWPGFLRRNALAALAKAERCGEGFAAAAERGLGDSYWEVRREALALILRFPAELGAVPALARGVISIVNLYKAMGGGWVAKADALTQGSPETSGEKKE